MRLYKSFTYWTFIIIIIFSRAMKQVLYLPMSDWYDVLHGRQGLKTLAHNRVFFLPTAIHQGSCDEHSYYL